MLDGDRLSDVEPGDRRRPCDSRTRSPARSSSVGARFVSTPGLASSGVRSVVESISSIPLSFMTAATAPIRPSVFREVSFLSAETNVRSGMMPPKIFVCLTCPAMTARVAPASRSRRMHVPKLTERDPVDRGAVPLGGVIELGERLFLHRDDGDVVAQCPRGIEDEKRKPAVAGNQTKCHSVAVPRSGFRVPGSCSRSSSRFDVPGSRFERRTSNLAHMNVELERPNTNLEHGTWNLERSYSSATSSSVRLVDLRRITPRCEVRMNSTR